MNKLKTEGEWKLNSNHEEIKGSKNKLYNFNQEGGFK